MDYAVEIAKALAYKMHKGVTFGTGDMFDQMAGVAKRIEKFYDGADKQDIIIAAWLHKCQESKRIHPDAQALTDTEIQSQFGDGVLSILTELHGEPNLKGASKEEENKAIAEWAKERSPAVQLIILAEKGVNFETSALYPNMKKPPEWHREYKRTLMIVANAVQQVNEALYKDTIMWADKINERFPAPQKVGENINPALQQAQADKNIHING